MRQALREWLYRMRGAACGCEGDYTSKMALEGFLQGKYAPAVFAHSTRSFRCFAHGDDVPFARMREDLERAAGKVKSWHEVKVRGIGGLRL